MFDAHGQKTSIFLLHILACMCLTKTSGKLGHLASGIVQHVGHSTKMCHHKCEPLVLKRPVLKSRQALRQTAQTLHQCCRPQCCHTVACVPNGITRVLDLQGTLVHVSAVGTAMPKHPKFDKANMTKDSHVSNSEKEKMQLCVECTGKMWGSVFGRLPAERHSVSLALKRECGLVIDCLHVGVAVPGRFSKLGPHQPISARVCTQPLATWKDNVSFA